MIAVRVTDRSTRGATVELQPSAGALDVRGLTKVYSMGATKVAALDGVSLTVQAGEFVALMGPSGAGKTTFFKVVSGLERPSGGEIYIGGASVHDYSESEMARVRRHGLGLIFQGFALIPELSVHDNIALPARLEGRRDADERALQLASAVGITDAGDRRPREISGGQQQRAAIARALMNDPQVLLADEPTASLDIARANAILRLLADRSITASAATLMATHSPQAAAYADRVLCLVDGKVADVIEPTGSVGGRMRARHIAAWFADNVGGKG